jgi:hemerythrin-like domain-containing protein
VAGVGGAADEAWNVGNALTRDSSRSTGIMNVNNWRNTMVMTARLAEDHGTLRALIVPLESALLEDTTCSPAIVKAVEQVDDRLRAHIAREARVVVSCSMAMGKTDLKVLDHFAIEHHDAGHSLKLIRRLLHGTQRFSQEWVRDILVALTTKLQRQMERQEAELYPLLEAHLSVASATVRATPPVRSVAASPHPALTDPLRLALGRTASMPRVSSGVRRVASF